MLSLRNLSLAYWEAQSFPHFQVLWRGIGRKKTTPTYESKNLFIFLLTYLSTDLSSQPHEHWSFQTDYYPHYFTARKLSHIAIKQSGQGHPESLWQIESGAEQSPWHILSSRKYSPHTKLYSQCLCKYLTHIEWICAGWARLLLCIRLSGAGFRIPKGEFVYQRRW